MHVCYVWFCLESCTSVICYHTFMYSIVNALFAQVRQERGIWMSVVFQLFSLFWMTTQYQQANLVAQGQGSDYCRCCSRWSLAFNKQKMLFIKGEWKESKYYITDRSIYGSKGGSTIGEVERVLFDVPCQGRCSQSNIPALSPLNSPSIVRADLLNPKHRVKSWTANETVRAVTPVTARRGKWDHTNMV